MAKFKCKITGNTVDFDLDWDIAQMKAHPDYEEVVEEIIKEEKKPSKKVKAEE